MGAKRERNEALWHQAFVALMQFSRTDVHQNRAPAWKTKNERTSGFWLTSSREASLANQRAGIGAGQGDRWLLERRQACTRTVLLQDAGTTDAARVPYRNIHRSFSANRGFVVDDHSSPATCDARITKEERLFDRASKGPPPTRVTDTFQISPTAVLIQVQNLQLPMWNFQLHDLVMIPNILGKNVWHSTCGHQRRCHEDRP